MRVPSQLLPTALDVAFLTGFWLLFFWDILVAKDHLIPYDLIDQHYMFQAFIYRALDAGQAPWWTPNILSGYPIVADPLSALFYPPNLLMHLLTPGADLPYIRMEFQATVHFLWAALGTYVLARSLTGSRAGAILAALTYAFGAFFAMHLPHLSPISSLSWLPWILFAYSRAIRLRSLLWIGLAAAAFGLMALAGHALTILQIGYLLVGITLLVVYHQWSADRRRAAGTAGIALAVLVLGAGLAMVQLLPSWELSGQTERADLSFADATGSSYAPHWVLTLLLPNFFAADGPAPYWGSGDIAETNMYAGLLPLLLASLGVARARAEDRGMTVLLLAGALLSLLLAFGSHTWVYRIAFVLPGIDHVRRPLNYVAFSHLALGLLAAYGVKALERDELDDGSAHYFLLGWLRRGLLVTLAAVVLAAILLADSVGSPSQQTLVTVINGIVFAGVILLATFAVLRGRLQRLVSLRVMLVLLVVIAAVDLGSAMAGKVYKNHAIRPNAYIGPTWAGDPGDPSVPLLLGEEQASLPERFRLYPLRTGSIWANGPLVWDLESIDGYSVLWPIYYRELFDAAVAEPNSPLFDLMNVRYVLTPEPIEQVHPGASARKFRLIHDGAPRIYENLAAGPRVWVAHAAVYQPEDATIAYLQANAASLRDVVVLNESPPDDPEARPARTGTAEIVSYENTRVVIRASIPAPGFVVLGDTWYPGWQARVDGEPAHLYRADHAFRAVWVPAGEHEVEFRFSSSTLRNGALFSGVALILITGLIVVGLVPLMRPIMVRTRPRPHRVQ